MDCSAPILAGTSLCRATDANPAIPLGLPPMGPPTSRRQASKTVQAKPPDIFGRWLKDRLDAERESVVAQLQELVLTHIGEHHRALLQDLDAHLATLPPPPLSLGAGAGRRPSLRPQAAPEPPPQSPAAKGLGARRPSQGSGASREREEHVRYHSSGQDHFGAKFSAVSAAHDRINEIAEDLNAQDVHGARSSSRWVSTGDLAPSTCVSWIVRRGYFEVFFSCCIVMSIMLMSLEMQYIGLGLGYALDVPYYTEPADIVWPHAEVIILVLSIAFTCLFFIELVLRVMDAGWKSCVSVWIWFDAFLLTIGIMDSVLRLGGRIDIGVKPNVLRVARLARVLRSLKLLRYQESFQSLFLLIKSLQVSAHALWWSCMMMFFAMLVAGMIINQSLYGYMEDPNLPARKREEVFLFFGTYTRMILTMFEITLGNWTPPKRVLIENVGEGWGFFIVLYRCILCFALVNITGAVFVTETNRAAAADDEVAIMNKERATKSTMKKLETLFSELDQTGDGLITWEEFKYLMVDEGMKNFLGSLQLDVEDAAECFRLLDDGDGRVMRDEFIKGIMTMRGQAKSMDLIILLKMVRHMDSKVDKLIGGPKSNATHKLVGA